MTFTRTSEEPHSRRNDMFEDRSWRHQLLRIDRLLAIVLANDPWKNCETLEYDDLAFFTAQSLWHLKDWIAHDPDFQANDINSVIQEIHADEALLICGDIANASKHLRLSWPKTSMKISEHRGVHVDSSKGMFREIIYVVDTNGTSRYHGEELTKVFRDARSAWDRIARTHFASAIFGLGQSNNEANQAS